MNNTFKQKKIFAKVFLTAYLAFAVTNAVHFHSYSLFPESSINNPSTTKSEGSHYFIEGSSLCVVHLFSSSILDLKFSSDDLSQVLNVTEQSNLLISDKLTSFFYLSKNSPRAPPVFS